MNLAQIFELIRQQAGKVEPIGKTLKFDLGDQQLHIDGTSDSNVISTENKDADCTVTMTAERFKDLVEGNLNPMTAVVTGKMKISGEMAVALKVQSIFG